ncbi:Threonylcarbamoyl-AMP synthase [Rickettsia tillamookensis]|uniref:Threonylcarbamoyl-AMP synthase n=1 Tax=Rickettsia tillamookensis TaxID=2761623 RepID=A0A9E6SQX3_9RICK|nr:L-threonylcarbamoyladenylate synthase [Rickettsia tillamookensis]QQV75763.1 Threonylcarbamoyl-AMP synthase [Rickettsia tillamookensis]
MISKAVQFIKSGKVVVFPTETVYGIGADATNNEACLKIFQFKNRPAINPLIVHVSSIEQANEIGKFNDLATKIAEKFWPGPLSIVVPLKENANIAPSVTAGLNTIAIRIPSYPLALELIRQSGVPIAAPSANPSNYISPTNNEHVTRHFSDNEEIFILAPEIYQSEYGLESTIIDTTTTNLTILREGFITAEILEEVLGVKVFKVTNDVQLNSQSFRQDEFKGESAQRTLVREHRRVLQNSLVSSFVNDAVKAPGMLAKHYSPKVPVRLNATNLEDKEIGLNFGDSKLTGKFSLNLSLKGDLIEAAANLYAHLRIFDDYAASHDVSGIAVAPIPSINIGAAINDRLKRAAKS